MSVSLSVKMHIGAGADANVNTLYIVCIHSIHSSKHLFSILGEISPSECLHFS